MKRIRPILIDSYLKFIKNSVGARSFCSFYARVNGKKEDILKNGDLSCAFFVSAVLVVFGLSDKTHMTVKRTIDDMKKSGWQEIKKPRPGAVILWEKMKQSKDEPRFHLGFVIGKDKTISNRWERKCLTLHHITYGTKNGKPVRKIEKIFWHERLN